MKPEDREWFDEQMKAFDKESANFESCRSFLQDAFMHVIKGAVCPHALIEARNKSKASFAGKILRKMEKYRNSLSKTTDLCGARIVVHTKNEVTEVCRVIRDWFEIDEANSLDQLERLKASQFGYRSVHFIVSLSQAKLDKMPLTPELRSRGVAVLGWQSGPPLMDRSGKPVILGRCAEIQLRTIPQHTWAVIGHDRLYKSDFEVPYLWEREFARIAALLEDVDDAFMRIADGLSTYRASYGVYHDRKKMEEELEVRRMVLEHDKKNAALTEDAARLAFCLGDWPTVNELVAGFAGATTANLLAWDGIASYKQNKDGRAALMAAVKLDSKNVVALGALADHHPPADKATVLRLYHQAFEIDPTNPWVLGGYLRFKLILDQDRSFIPLIRPTLEAAIARCREHARLGIDLPWAYRYIAAFNLLLARPDERLEKNSEVWPEHDDLTYQGLNAVAKAVQLHRTSKTTDAMIDDWLATLDALKELKPPLEGLEWVRRLLLLGKAVSSPAGKTDPRFQELQTSAAERVTVNRNKPVVIVAGGCDPIYEKEMAGYSELLFGVFASFEGTLYSGGTNAGIAGIVGELAKKLKDRAQAYGYVPSNTPAKVTSDEKLTGYTKAYAMPGRDPRFSPLQPLQNWIDLICMDVDPGDVKLLGINGGRIAAFEYRLALALGAQVGLVVDSGREVGSLQADPDWRDDFGLVLLPRDGDAVKQFLERTREIQPLARLIHRAYLRQNKPRDGAQQASMVEWRELPERYRDDNRRLADDHLKKHLTALGLKALPVKDREIELYRIDEKDIERLARIEHESWRIGKEKKGWQPGPERNEDLKLHPDLRPWNELLDWVREKNREIIRQIPRLLKEVGMEVTPIDGRMPPA